jgi:hypothetical protein
MVDGLGARETPLLQILQGLGTRLQGLLVVGEDLVEKELVVEGSVEHGRQFQDRRVLHFARRLVRCAAPKALSQELDGMAEAHAFRLHHPVDRGATGLTSAQAVPEVLGGRDHQRRFVVVVKRTQPEEIAALALELDSLCLGQGGDADFLQPPDLLLSNPCHGRPSEKVSTSWV